MVPMEHTAPVLAGASTGPRALDSTVVVPVRPVGRAVRATINVRLVDMDKGVRRYVSVKMVVLVITSPVNVLAPKDGLVHIACKEASRF